MSESGKNEWRLKAEKEYRTLMGIALFFGAVGLLGAIFTGGYLQATCITCIILSGFGIIHMAGNKEKIIAANEKLLSEQDKNKLTPEEREAQRKRDKELRSIEQNYKYGHLTTQQYDLLKSKYTGTPNMYQTMGYSVAEAYYKKTDIDKAIAEHNRTADKRVIYNAALGSAVGGLGGTIIGASNAANNVAREAAALQMKKAEADAKYEKALKDRYK